MRENKAVLNHTALLCASRYDLRVLRVAAAACRRHSRRLVGLVASVIILPVIDAIRRRATFAYTDDGQSRHLPSHNSSTTQVPNATNSRPSHSPASHQLPTAAS